MTDSSIIATVKQFRRDVDYNIVDADMPSVAGTAIGNTIYRALLETGVKTTTAAYIAAHATIDVSPRAFELCRDDILHVTADLTRAFVRGYMYITDQTHPRSIEAVLMARADRLAIIISANSSASAG